MYFFNTAEGLRINLYSSMYCAQAGSLAIAQTLQCKLYSRFPKICVTKWRPLAHTVRKSFAADDCRSPGSTRELADATAPPGGCEPTPAMRGGCSATAGATNDELELPPSPNPGRHGAGDADGGSFGRTLALTAAPVPCMFPQSGSSSGDE